MQKSVISDPATALPLPDAPIMKSNLDMTLPRGSL